jgi:hypothetical protein
MLLQVARMYVSLVWEDVTSAELKPIFLGTQTRQVCHVSKRFRDRLHSHFHNSDITQSWFMSVKQKLLVRHFNQSIIWHYNPLWVLAFSVNSLHVLLSLAVSFQCLTFSFFQIFHDILLPSLSWSSYWSSSHRFLIQ